jgi:hypothetical protein
MNRTSRRFPYLYPPFRADFVALEVSGGYKLISRRIEAMKNFHSFSRRRLLLAGSAIALLTVVAIVPWRLVAQEKKPAARQGMGNAAETSKESALPEKLIVGTWVPGASSGELTFRSDGTYQEFARFVQSFAPQSPVPTGQQFINEHGKWTLENNLLTLTADSQAPGLRGSPFRKRTQPAPQTPGASAAASEGGEGAAVLALAPPPRPFKIVRLDDSFLRMTPIVSNEPGGVGADTGTYFYRRDKEKSAPQQFDSSVPDELKQLAELAQLTPKDALSLLEWFKSHHLRDMQLQLIDRIASARRGKLDFQELFDLTEVENKSLAELLDLVGGLDQIYGLADVGQLAPDEAGAATKLRQLKNDLSEIKGALEKSAGEQSAVNPPERLNALSKLKAYIDELAWYMDETVFNPSGHYPGGGGYF